MECGSWCVFYRDRATASICKTCSYYEEHKPKVELGKVDIWKLAKLLKEKEEKERR
jgi:hypothetical protein